MNRVVITTIFSPTKAISAFSKRKGLHCIIVGDLKTPKDWRALNCTYLSVEKQKSLSFKIVQKLPYNHYTRKLVGYLYAIKVGASVIIDTDDDNAPKENFKIPKTSGVFSVIRDNAGFVNIYKLFTEADIWPRGFPLELIRSAGTTVKAKDLIQKEVSVGIWQGLVDGDSDVDAIFRLTNNAKIRFNSRLPFVLGRGTIAPFNTQNTIFTAKELFPLLYLPAYVPWRSTDIIRSYVAQPILWQTRYRLGVTEATMFQERNPHDLLKDFESEIPCYLYAGKMVNIVDRAIRQGKPITENLYLAYEALHKNGIVERRELDMLKNWISDINEVLKRP